MTKKLVSIQLGTHRFIAEFFNTPTADAIVDALPFTSKASTWGDEIYFSVPAQAALEDQAQSEVEVGDLAYWPTMPAFCIFFGPTPASLADEPRAASAVNVFGRLLDVDVNQLRQVKAGDTIKVSRVES